MAADMYQPLYLTKAPRRFRFIIIHDTNCQWQKNNIYKIDNNLFQAGPMRARFKLEKRWWESPYHFICEKIGENYQTILGKPLQYSSENEFPDLDNTYSRFGIHVCVMGNYNIMAHKPKMYEQLCYRVIAPMLRQYRIPKSNIFLHGELSKEHMDCPGLGFSKQALLAYLARFLMGIAR